MSATEETENKIDRCLTKLRECNRHLQTYINGTVLAPGDGCSNFCKRAAHRQLRHIIKLAELVRYYQRGGK